MSVGTENTTGTELAVEPSPGPWSRENHQCGTDIKEFGVRPPAHRPQPRNRKLYPWEAKGPMCRSTAGPRGRGTRKGGGKGEWPQERGVPASPRLVPHKAGWGQTRSGEKAP